MSGVVALASHAVKAGIRLGINTSPEPASNILASLTEDGLVAIVVLFAVEHPYLAATIAAVLLAVGLTLIAFLWSRVRAALRRRRRRRAGLPPEEERPVSGRLRRWPVAFAVLALAGAAVAAILVAGGQGYSGDPRGADVEQFEIDSGAVGRSEPVSLVIPPGAKDEGRPLLVLLHGRDGDENSMLTDPMFAALDDLGDRAPVIVAPDGGTYSYWHDRDMGDWGSYVVDEVIPEAIDRSGADPGRVAIGGISMGGFGAFDLARLNPGEFCAAGGHSPAIWATAEETAPGAFDDAEDFAAHDLVTAAGADPAGLDGPELWLDAGDADPFLPGDDAFVAALEGSGIDVERHGWPGGHDGGYWGRHWGDYLGFYADALERC
jgi:S-formylglutathione hydrolase FrmB